MKVSLLLCRPILPFLAFLRYHFTYLYTTISLAFNPRGVQRDGMRVRRNSGAKSAPFGQTSVQFRMERRSRAGTQTELINGQDN